MDEATFEARLNELLQEIGSVPSPQQGKLVELARKTDDSHKKLRKSMDGLQESLDYLRFSIKYLLFDLEATRREKAHLQRLLDEKGK